MSSEIHLRDEDRLPWLETVEADDPEQPGAGRVTALVVLGLLVLAALVFAVYRLTSRAPVATSGGGQVIAAPAGDYKVRPGDPGGLKVGGEGDAAIATSTGTRGGGARIDTRQVPEKPVTGTHAAPAAASARQTGTKVVAALPPSGGKLAAAPPVAAPRATVPGATSGGGLVQLGAFPSEATANQAWAGFAKRFGYLATLGKVVQPAQVGTRTVYRLRVNAGSSGAAADLCGRLKVAGEDCFVTAG